ncbi:MAG: hypothetical protein ABEJ36_03320 [Candidatus Nanosalina sp.]
MSSGEGHQEEDVEVVGDYDPEIEEMVREAKRDQSFFDDPDELDEVRTRRAKMMQRDPVMSRAVDAYPEDFEGFHVEDDEFTERVERVERSLDDLGIDHTRIEIGSDTYEQLVETGELDDDDVSFFYVSGRDSPAELLGEVEQPDVEGVDRDVWMVYGDPGYEDTVPVDLEGTETEHVDVTAPSTDAYRRRNESGLE